MTDLGQGERPGGKDEYTGGRGLWRRRKTKNFRRIYRIRRSFRIFISCICCSGTVSYTHLDVYKRQEYSSKNTLATIYRARKVLEGRNMYLLSSDNWLRENMYHAYECGAWYSSAFQKGDTKEWCLTFQKRCV